MSYICPTNQIATIMKPPMNTETGHTEMLRALQHEAAVCVTKNILPFWLTRMRDRDRGGWYGRMTGSGVTERDAVRGAILYGRLLWTFSAAHRVLGKRAQRACHARPWRGACRAPQWLATTHRGTSRHREFITRCHTALFRRSTAHTPLTCQHILRNGTHRHHMSAICHMVCTEWS